MLEHAQHATKKTWEEYVQVLRRRRVWVAGAFFGGWLAVFAAGWVLPAEFRSEAFILAEQQAVPKDLVTPNVSSDLQERLQTMTQEILSRTRLQHVIEEHNLYRRLRSRLSPDELIERMRSDIQIEVVRATQGARNQETTAFKISYEAPSPKLSQDVTAELAGLFIDENLRTRQQQSEDTTNFLENQLATAQKSLQEQEEKIQAFKSQYITQLPQQTQMNAQLMTTLQNRVQSLSESLNQAEQQKLYLESLSAQYHALHSDIRRGQGGDDPELARMKTELADLRSKYTENHPDVKRLKQQIAQAEKAKRSAPAPTADGSLQASDYNELNAMSPVLQIDSQLKANKLEIENKRAEIKQLEAQLAGYQGRMMMTPLREQQLANLTRDYEQSRTNYESLLTKKNSSELATNLERRQQGEQFRLIDPASLPTKPSFPDRLKLSLFGLLAGIFCAVGAVAAKESTDDRVYGTKDLKEIISARVLATIPPIATAAELTLQAQTRRKELLVALSGAAVVVAGIAVSYWKG